MYVQAMRHFSSCVCTLCPRDGSLITFVVCVQISMGDRAKVYKTVKFN